jgi:hypothetical protein
MTHSFHDRPQLDIGSARGNLISCTRPNSALTAPAVARILPTSCTPRAPVRDVSLKPRDLAAGSLTRSDSGCSRLPKPFRQRVMRKYWAARRLVGEAPLSPAAPHTYRAPRRRRCLALLSSAQVTAKYWSPQSPRELPANEWKHAITHPASETVLFAQQSTENWRAARENR